MFLKKIYPYGLGLILFVSAVSSCKHDIPQPIITHTDSIIPPLVEENRCDTDTVYFQNTILPLFVSNCAISGCHNTTSHVSGYKLNNYSNIMSTGNILAFKPNHGNIVDAISSTDPNNVMPPPSSGLNSLSTQQILDN